MIISILVVVGYVGYSDPETRFLIGKILGIKKTPESLTNDLIVEEFITGLSSPTTMIFVDKDIIFLEKNTGKVRLIKNNILTEEPLFDFNVSNQYELGLLGITKQNSSIYIYVTESDIDGGKAFANNIYRFVWKDEKLIDQTLVKTLPAYGLGHVGGVLVTSEDGVIYGVTGDQRGPLSPVTPGLLQNNQTGIIDDTGVIFKIDDNSSPNLTNQIDDYVAIGIRNSFGLAIDPITKNLWATENGPKNFDEINLIFPNFNSGWNQVMGHANDTQISNLQTLNNFSYADPKFSWEDSIAPTALIFIDNPTWSKFNNSLLVGNCYGSLYKFNLNQDRTGFEFVQNSLHDLVLNYDDSDSEILLLSNLGCVTDLEIGPDNALYLISHANNGAIYRIIPN